MYILLGGRCILCKAVLIFDFSLQILSQLTFCSPDDVVLRLSKRLPQMPPFLSGPPRWLFNDPGLTSAGIWYGFGRKLM